MRGLMLVVAMGAVACGPPTMAVPKTAESCDSANLDRCKDQCDQGQSRACYRVGWFYEQGVELPQDNKKAVDLYKRACDNDFAVACRSLGELYWDGEKVKRDYSKALQFYRKACSLGVFGACPTDDMVVAVEGKGAKGSASGSVRVQIGSPDAPDAPEGPSAPDAPSAPDTPSVNTPKPPSAPTPSIPGT